MADISKLKTVNKLGSFTLKKCKLYLVAQYLKTLTKHINSKIIGMVDV